MRNCTDCRSEFFNNSLVLEKNSKFEKFIFGIHYNIWRSEVRPFACLLLTSDGLDARGPFRPGEARGRCRPLVPSSMTYVASPSLLSGNKLVTLLLTLITVEGRKGVFSGSDFHIHDLPVLQFSLLM